MAVTIQTGRVNRLTDLTIDVSEDDNATDSFLDPDVLRQFSAILISAPATLSGTVTVAVLNDETADETADAQWNTLQSGGSDVEVAAGKSTFITEMPLPGLRLESSAAETGDRTFTVFGIKGPGKAF